MPRRLIALSLPALATLSLAGCAEPAPSVAVAERAEEAIPAPGELPATDSARAADDALYQERWNRLVEAARTGIGLDGYDTLVELPGAEDHEPLPEADPGERTIAAQALERAREYAAANNSSAFMVWRYGRLEAEAYFGDTTAETPLVSRSLAKPLTAIAVGRAMALGHIDSLDQPVADFITEWSKAATREQPMMAGKPSPPRDGDAASGDAGEAELERLYAERRRKILVRHLLDMRSGFLPQDVSMDPAHILNRAYLHPRHDEVIIEEYPVVDEPGTRYEYNNATSELVAVLIERATGQRYDRFVAEHILKPLGAQGGEIWVNRPGGTPHSGCCVLLPAETWMRFAVLLLNDGVWNGERLLPAGYVDEMTEGTPQYPYYGLGVYVAGPYTERRGFANPERAERFGGGVLHSEPYLAEDVFLFDGNGNQVVYVIPSEQLVVMRLGGRLPEGREEWDNSFLPNTILRGIEQPTGERIMQKRSD